MELLFYVFAILYACSIGAGLFSYFEMRRSANRNLPPNKQLPRYVGDSWGVMHPISTYYTVGDEYRSQFPNSSLPKVCAWSILITFFAFIGFLVTGSLQSTP
jgi:hypothetical protein